MSISNSVVQKLETIVGIDNIILDEAIRHDYGHDASWHESHAPDIVVFPENVEQVQNIMQLATESRTFVTPYGSGTGFEGNAIPISGGITLSLARLNKILSLDTHNMVLEAEAGVKLLDTERVLRPHGLWIPTFPGTLEPTLGAIVSTNASGKRSTLYGCTGDYVLTLDVVLADGTLIHVGRPVQKTVASYDLKRLFVGSEGTLGIIVKVALRVIPIREGTAMAAHFKSLEQALAAVESLRQEDLQLSILEFSDARTTDLMLALGAPLRSGGDVLLLEIHQLQRAPDIRINLIEDICVSHGCVKFSVDFSRQEETALWRCRDDACALIYNHYPDRIDHNGELVVPTTKFTQLVMMAQALAAEQGIPILTFGHAGQGNLHTSVLGRRDMPSEIKASQEINDRLVTWAIDAGGTSTGEHGIGLSKLEHLLHEHPTIITYMQAIKDVFDPLGILNPGKKLPSNT